MMQFFHLSFIISETNKHFHDFDEKLFTTDLSWFYKYTIKGLNKCDFCPRMEWLG